MHKLAFLCLPPRGRHLKILFFARRRHSKACYSFFGGLKIRTPSTLNITSVCFTWESKVMTVKHVAHVQVVKLVQEIVKLNMIETREMIKMLKKELNFPDMPMGMPMGMQMMGGGVAPAAAPAGVAAEAAAPVVEKTEFELKLESFNAPDKLKVIKEVRAITGLGLKESKELVEKSPSIIKAGLTKEDAEKFKKVLEDNGGKVEIV